ncbi:copper transporter 6 isoform X2 [Elaeis guineensis]|uniref:Copper transport protein n=1 Tax=Elaeis guineensis var. tenera TaxID=51953 RepID=A0A8N4IAN1_ELAGV|nr:copper transporter 6 isoform X2 [Elaeis guineensis]
MAMGRRGVMDDGMGGMTVPTMPGHHEMGGDMAMRMTFFWGKRVEVLFSGWPGDRGLGMYLLALLCVVATASLAECLSPVSDRLSQAAPTAATGSGRRISTAVLLTFLHAVRLGLLYLVMLAVMSFNVGVLIAAIAGHALGFLLSASGLCKRARPGDGEYPGNHVMPSTKR